MEKIKTWSEFQEIINEQSFTLIYFSHDKCNVCKVLLPKIKTLINSDFPQAKIIYCNTENAPEAAAQNRVFTVPSILIFIEGKEHHRFSRNISITELTQSISRPYHLMFD